MWDDPSKQFTDAECEAVFAQLFPTGCAGDDVLREIAPEGWEQSPLLAVFHPSIDQVYRERVQVHENFESLPCRDKNAPIKPASTREAVAREFRETPVQLPDELRDLVAHCLWDVFSDNHEVIGADGRVVDIGSFRGAAAFIADWLNREIVENKFDYMDFYMGTIWIRQRADLSRVYRMIFRRLHAGGFDWVYHFPRLGLVDLRPLRDEIKKQDGPEWQNYSPSASFAQDEEDRRCDHEISDLRANLDRAYRASIENVRHLPPPSTVEAFHAEYGRFPRGWPPD